MSQSEFVALRVSGGQVRYAGKVFRPRLDASYLNGTICAFGLYYEPAEIQVVDGERIYGRRWDSSKIAYWGTERMLRIMEQKGWPSQWSERDITLLAHPESGSRIGMMIWREAGSYT